LTFKAIFLDFYGTVVHEDDNIIPIICEQIMERSLIECTVKEIGQYWWNSFSKLFQNSYGETFKTQRNLGIKSLNETIQHFKSNCIAEELIQMQFNHWQEPGIFEDSLSFVKNCELPIYILSNIDTEDIMSAIKYHDIPVDGVITSEDVRSYKPRSEIFIKALKKFDLKNNEVVHIGDSLTSDVIGAQTMGIHAVWINRKNKLKPEHINPDYIFKNLLEVKMIL